MSLFGKIGKAIGGVAKIAAPVLGGLVGGPFGAAAGSAVSGLISGSGEKKDVSQGANYLNQNLAPYTQAGQQAVGQQASLLGLGDPASGQAGLQNYLNSTGYQFQLGQGTDAITGNAAARGLLNSGSTLKALNNYGQGMGASYFNNYLNQLGNVAGAGQNAASTVGGAMANAGVNKANISSGVNQNFMDLGSAAAENAPQILKGVGNFLGNIF